jgi:A/G-specific adenine glycosylase
MSADPDTIAFVQRELLTWFDANRRDLPWRHTRDPYRVLVSEVMLQQTQVDRVIPYYERFLARFPSVHTLAEAPTADVIEAWAGLGYNRRAVNLQRTAQAVVVHFAGEFPRDPEQLRSLPGIGPYTAGAIAAFAFEQEVAFVDTNMRRVVHRLFFGVDVPVPIASDRELLEIAVALVPAGQSWAWNQALIEFGALLCTARRPACVICPLQTECCAFPLVQSVIAMLPKGVRKKNEAPFAGSNRFYRGRVLAALRDRPRGDDPTLTELGQLVRADFAESDLPWLRVVVDGLAKDGLAKIAEETPAYDVRDLANVRVSLP